MSKLTKTSKVVATSFSREWKNKQGGTNYTFEVEFENGDKGEFNTNKNPQIKFVEGETVQYTIEEVTIQTSRGPWKKTKIDKVREEGGRQYSNDPEIQIRIIRTVALKCAVRSLIFSFPDKMNDIANRYIDWISEKGLEQDKAIPAQSAISEAISFYETTQKSPETVDKLIELAEVFYNFIRKSDKNDE